MAHVSDQFHAHEFHFVMDKIACTITRVSSKDHFRACFGFDGVHHFEGLHLQTLWDLKRNQAVVIRLDAFHQFVKLEIVAVQIHSRPCCRGSPPPHQSTL